MDLFWAIDWEEMLGDLMVTTFLILLAASIAVVCLMVMFPLIDFAFKKKAKPAPAQVETWQYDGLTHAQFALAHPPRERITPLIDRSLVPARSLQGFPLILDHNGKLAGARLEISNPPSTNLGLQPAISDRSAA